MFNNREYYRGGKCYIRDWWEMNEYKDVFKAKQNWSGVRPDIDGKHYNLINAIYKTGIDSRKFGWFYSVTKQNLIDIKNELDILKNNQNNNRFNENNYQYNNNGMNNNNNNLLVKNNVNSRYMRLYNQSNRQEDNMQQFQIKMQRMENEYQKQLREYKEYVEKELDKMENKLKAFIQNNDLGLLERAQQNAQEIINKIDGRMQSVIDNRREHIVPDVLQNSTTSTHNVNNGSVFNSNLTRNSNTNINNTNNHRSIANYHQNNSRLTNNNNNNNYQAPQVDNILNNNRDLNRDINFDNWWNKKEYQPLLLAVQKYGNMNAYDFEEDNSTRNFIELVKRNVNVKSSGWWYDVKKEQLDKIKKGYDLFQKQIKNNRYNANNNRNTNIKKHCMADHEVHSGSNNRDNIVHFNVDHIREIQERYYLKTGRRSIANKGTTVFDVNINNNNNRYQSNLW